MLSSSVWGSLARLLGLVTLRAKAAVRITRRVPDQRALARVMIALVASLEDHAIRRDKGFVVKLVVALVVTAIAGFWALQHLTSDRAGEVGAEMLGYEAPPGEGATP
jgi:hypothetical protein